MYGIATKYSFHLLQDVTKTGMYLQITSNVCKVKSLEIMEERILNENSLQGVYIWQFMKGEKCGRPTGPLVNKKGFLSFMILG